MGHAFDLVIRAGRIVDGTGRVEIDARGAIATPGFVDIHAHYDGQVTWESFPEYLSFLAGRRYDMDICGYVPHAALRVYVTGARGANREPATPADIARMAELLGEAIDAGAMGFSTSLSLLHRSIDGASTPTYGVAGRELMALAMVLRQRGRGAMQVIVDFDAPGEAFGMLRRLAADSGRPLSFSLFEGRSAPRAADRRLAPTGSSPRCRMPCAWRGCKHRRAGATARDDPRGARLRPHARARRPRPAALHVRELRGRLAGPLPADDSARGHGARARRRRRPRRDRRRRRHVVVHAHALGP